MTRLGCCEVVCIISSSFFICITAIPALKPVIQDLFVSKGQGRVDSGKELDTQREVAFSMLFRLIQYPEVSCHRDFGVMIKRTCGLCERELLIFIAKFDLSNFWFVDLV